MMNAHFSRILVAASVALPASLPGQGVSDETGRRVRVTVVGQPQQSFVGTSLGFHDGALYLRPASHRRDEPDTLVIPQSSIGHIDFSNGLHGHFLVGLLVGGAAGAGLGAAALGSTSCKAGNAFAYQLCGAGAAPVGAIFGGIAGLVTGGIVGALIRTERWTPIAPTIVTGRTASGRSARTIALGVRLAM
jgi:hypothetical protein